MEYAPIKSTLMEQILANFSSFDRQNPTTFPTWLFTFTIMRNLVSLAVGVIVLFAGYRLLMVYIRRKDPRGIYKSLQLDPANEEIRLLQLEPGEWNDPIRCQLKIEYLGEKPTFTALSYAWAEDSSQPSSPHQSWILTKLQKYDFKLAVRYFRLVFGDSRKRLVYVNDLQHEVGVNLERALRHMREKPGSSKIKLWADAICINQDNTEDRNIQVSGMRRVYKAAERVEIWLGSEWDVGGFNDSEQEVTCDRESPSIPEDPRRGIDVVWHSIGSHDQNIATNGTVTTNDLNGFCQADYVRVRNAKQNWYNYNNRPKFLRAEMTPDYTMEFFCMLSLLAGPAFFHCEENLKLQKSQKPLDIRIPFLLSASARGPVLEVFQEVMNRLWWNRLWVVQETVIAKKLDVRYGRFVVPWESLVSAAKNFYIHSQKECCSADFEKLPPSDVGRLEQFANTVCDLDIWRQSWTKDSERDDPKIKLLRLLWQFRSRSTSEPRDKIYALLPLVNYWGRGKHNSRIHPKYEWTVADVYKNAVRHILEMEQSLHVLLGNTIKSKSLEHELPSWAPDWSEPPTNGEIARLQRANLYNAAKDTEMHFRVLRKNKYLELRGIRHDVVRKVSHEMPQETCAASYTKAQKTFKAWKGLADLEATGSDFYLDTGYKKWVAFWRTICMGTIYTGKENDDDNALELDKQDYEPISDSYGEEFINWDNPHLSKRATQRNMTFKPDDSPLSSAPPSPISKRSSLVYPAEPIRPSTPAPDPGGFPPIRHLTRIDSPRDNPVAKMNKSVGTATVSRRFFVTSEGYMGLGPAHMREGDVVFILFGGPMPFLLRSVHEDSSSSFDFNDLEDEELDESSSSPTNSSDGTQEQPDGTNCQGLVSTETLQQRKQHLYSLIGDCYVQGIMNGEAAHKMEGGKKIPKESHFIYLT